MAAPATEAELKADAEKNSTTSRFFYRQLCLTPILPQNVSLKGKTAIVTGANQGIGLETSRQLLDLGLSKLIIAVRDESKGKTARKNLSQGRSLADDAIEVWKLDMLSYESITAFVERVKTLERLDIVILNAGIMKQTFEVTSSTGHEETIQVNYLSTALLAILLLPIFNVRAKGRVSANDAPEAHLVWVQTEVAGWAKFKEKDSTPLLAALDKPETFNIMDRYGTSKLLGQLFVTELAKRAHGQFMQECIVQAKAAFVYQDDGGRVTQQLWKETMAELSFAGAEDIVRELSK
ncbi:putative retinol dehydrogenase 12 [Mollisia scopiformis]|uniref:Putative retinol dehydrogenase 12 n=1 Tax=Mollisia scopiformis TaxID=149040 RepID=A0A194XRR6_MOLSC|nr:putative retinol dehydrogenase 12 [Mollisia scopiformis]KUJ22985.1 putative retinol dehydrogenase 12 [Mollisia scopiformis]